MMDDQTGTKEHLPHGTDIQALKPILILFCIVGASTILLAFATIWGGRWLDTRFGTSPWIMIILGFLGLIIDIGVITLSSMSVSRKIQAILKEKKEKEGHK